jgi:hypothetical protein
MGRDFQMIMQVFNQFGVTPWLPVIFACIAGGIVLAFVYGGRSDE